MRCCHKRPVGDESMKGLGQCDVLVSFATYVIRTQAERAASVPAADLDGDSDLDVLSASTGDGNVAWYENLDRVLEFFGAAARHCDPDQSWNQRL